MNLKLSECIPLVYQTDIHSRRKCNKQTRFSRSFSPPSRLVLTHFNCLLLYNHRGNKDIRAYIMLANQSQVTSLLVSVDCGDDEAQGPPEEKEAGTLRITAVAALLVLNISLVQLVVWFSIEKRRKLYLRRSALSYVNQEEDRQNNRSNYYKLFAFFG